MSPDKYQFARYNPGHDENGEGCDGVRYGISHFLNGTEKVIQVAAAKVYRIGDNPIGSYQS